MGKIEDAIKKINVEIQKEPNEEVLAKIGEYIIDQITTEEVAEKILAEDKSLKKIYGEIKEEETVETVWELVAMVKIQSIGF